MGFHPKPRSILQLIATRKKKNSNVFNDPALGISEQNYPLWFCVYVCVFFLQISWIFVCLFCYLWIYCECLQTHQKRASDPITDGLWATLWVLGIELGTSGREVSALEHWVISFLNLYSKTQTSSLSINCISHSLKPFAWSFSGKLLGRLLPMTFRSCFPFLVPLSNLALTLGLCNISRHGTGRVLKHLGCLMWPPSTLLPLREGGWDEPFQQGPLKYQRPANLWLISATHITSG